MHTPLGICQICGSSNLREVVGFANLPRITSDCRPFPAGGFLAVCSECGSVQKSVTAQWLSEISEIYSSYAAYYQSGGDEQIVFDSGTGQPRRRSDVLIERLRFLDKLADKGDMLDIGCGNGVTLRSMGHVFPDWQLNGFEIGSGNQQRLEEITNFTRLYTHSLEDIDRRFDLVTMIHSLEHFSVPAEALADIGSNICDHHIFIEVCNIDENPFDILVADHLMHFSPNTLARLLQKTGFKTVSIATDWVSKEISLLACVNPQPEENIAENIDNNPQKIYHRITAYVHWLTALRDEALRSASSDHPFGIFGTSIASTWLAPQLSNKVSFFVDEDQSRIGRQHLGCPIISPVEIPNHAVVFIPLAPGVAAAIFERLANLPCTLVLPPAMPD